MEEDIKKEVKDKVIDCIKESIDELDPGIESFVSFCEDEFLRLRKFGSEEYKHNLTISFTITRRPNELVVSPELGWKSNHKLPGPSKFVQLDLPLFPKN